MGIIFRNIGLKNLYCTGIEKAPALRLEPCSRPKNCNFLTGYKYKKKHRLSQIGAKLLL